MSSRSTSTSGAETVARVLILDSEAVSALAEKRKGMAERLAAAQQADHRVLIPAVVLAEVATGAPTDAAIWHVLGRIPTLDLPQGVAMRAGLAGSVGFDCGAGRSGRGGGRLIALTDLGRAIGGLVEPAPKTE